MLARVDTHEMLALELAFSNKSSQPRRLREEGILSKTAGDLTIPWLLRFRAERSSQIRQVFFDLPQPALHLLNR